MLTDRWISPRAASSARSAACSSTTVSRSSIVVLSAGGPNVHASSEKRARARAARRRSSARSCSCRRSGRRAQRENRASSHARRHLQLGSQAFDSARRVTEVSALFSISFASSRLSLRSLRLSPARARARSPASIRRCPSRAPPACAVARRRSTAAACARSAEGASGSDRRFPLDADDLQLAAFARIGLSREPLRRAIRADAAEQ